MKPDILIGTLGKAIGLHGAFVAGAEEVREFFWNKARSFIFSTAISPALAEQAAQRVPQVAAAVHRRQRLFEAASRFRQALSAEGQSPLGEGPIIPWVLGETARAERAQTQLTSLGVAGIAIRAPTVPNGAARLRLTAGSWMSDADIAVVCEALSATARGFLPIG